MSTETTTETTTNTETVNGVTVQTETTVETTVDAEGKTTRKTTVVETTTDAEGKTTSKTSENTEVFNKGEVPPPLPGQTQQPPKALKQRRHHHHDTPEEKEKWRQEKKERKEQKLKNIVAHVNDDEEKNIAEFFRLTNEYRQKNGKEPLNLVDSISAIAKEHNDLMLSFQRNLGHEGFKERSQKIENSKCNAENCGFSSDGPDILNKLLQLFINDPPHNKNLLGDYNSIGIAIGKNSRNQWFVTQIFAKVQ